MNLPPSRIVKRTKHWLNDIVSFTSEAKSYIELNSKIYGFTGRVFQKKALLSNPSGSNKNQIT